MLKLYDTYKKKKLEFKPIEEGKVRMYTCGPTVYFYPTIGNLRGFMFDDVLRRTLEYLGYEVTQVMNITDVGHLTLTDLQKETIEKEGKEIEITDTDDGLDRMEKTAKKEGISTWDVAKKYIDATFGKNYKTVKEFENDGMFGKMNFEKAEFIPRATEMIDEQIELIKKLEAKGFTYKTKEAVYFDISKFPKYEELAGQSFDEMRKGDRANVTDKDRKHPADFRLWQLDQPDHEMLWDSPWGKGFPGWHIECSAMSGKLLGTPFDIHTGGEDHIKVHHPSEMAQTESATGKPMANYWMHNAFLTVDGKRMGKSLGNAYTLDDIIEKGFDPMDLRYFYLTARYRVKQDFSWSSLETARNEIQRLEKRIRNIKKENIQSTIDGRKDRKKDFVERFVRALEDDLNTPLALSVLWSVVKSGEYLATKDKLELIKDFDKVLGLNLNKVKTCESGIVKKVIQKGTKKVVYKRKRIQGQGKEKVWNLVEDRLRAKEENDWLKADEMRIILEDKFKIRLEDKKDHTGVSTMWTADIE
jgi:cysteinyl-tRNA synthetase